MTGAPCPTDDALSRVLAAHDSGEANISVQSHLDQCESCQRRLERMASDSFADETLQGALTEEPPSSARLVATIDRLSRRSDASGFNKAPRYDDLNPWINSTSDDDDSVEMLDRYVLLGCIGRGGMGVVFRAQEPGQEQVFALKTMLPELARDDRARERFLREAKAIAAVRHPNVVALHAVSEVDGLPYLIMEHVEGVSLEDRLRHGPPLAADEIVQIGAAVASGIAACHSKSVIHRDIKPSNVLLRADDGAVKITDFGLALVASTPTLTQHGHLAGTPDYIAPERLTIGAEADERSDLFSLGCLLYKMATGEEPFGGDTPLITLHRIATDRPPSVRVKNTSIPVQLEKAIESLMEKRPEDRPASAREARDLLLGDTRLPRFRMAKPRWLTGLALVLGVVVLFPYAMSLRHPSTPTHDASETRSDLDASGGVAAQPDSPANIIVTTAAELESAVDMVPDGGRIELDTDAILDVAPLYIDGKSVTIAATEGRKPAIRLKVSKDSPAPEYLLRMHYGTLNLLGLDLQDNWSPKEQLRRIGEEHEAVEDFSLLSLVDADLEVRGCRFQTQTEGSCVKLDPGNSCVLQNTKIFATNGTAINWRAIDGDDLQLNDCVVVGNVALIVELDGHAETIWNGSTLLANLAIFELAPVYGQLTARVSGCLIQPVEALVITSVRPPTLAAFKQKLAWHGVGNRIRKHEVFLSNGDYSPSWNRKVALWAASDHGSTYRKELFTEPHRDVIKRLMKGLPVEDLVLDPAMP